MFRWREWHTRLALALGAPLIVLGGLELVLRIADVGYQPDFWVSVDERTLSTTNDAFGWRFFPRQLARTPVPAILDVKKPANTRRVFVLGESAAMGFPEPGVGLAPMLERILERQQPEVRWEVHNAAMTAINSHVIVEIARDCARLQPDVFVVLMGNNEAVGPYGPATVFGRTGLSRPLVRAAIWQSGTRMGQLITRLLPAPELAPAEWRGMEMFLKQRIGASDERLRAMYSHFRTNLEEIVSIARNSGAKVVLATVPVNLRDCPPFASLNEGAEGLFRRAAFREARDADALRFRADSEINDIIRQIGQKRVDLVDAEAEFGLPGDDLFWEHVHLRPEGTYKLAVLIARRISGSDPTLTFDETRRTLPITAWDDHRLRAQIAALMERPPFTAQTGNRERVARLKPSVDPKPLHAEAISAYEAALVSRPNDIHVRMRYAELLREAGHPDKAAAQWAALIEALPGRKIWHASRAAALSDAGQQALAIEECRRALILDPQFDMAHFGLGVANTRLGQHDEAAGHYRRALEINSAYAEAAYNLAGSLAALGRADEAQAELERAVAAQPGFAEAHAALGQLHARKGREREAIDHYRRALASKPQLAEAHYDLGVLLARQGLLEEALLHYREAIRIRPEYVDAHNNLGTALARRGDFSGAAVAFARALELRPSFEAARANLERARRADAGRR